MPFHFRLKPLLAVRTSERHLCEQAVAIARAEFEALDKACGLLLDQRYDLVRQIRQLNESPILDVTRIKRLHELSGQLDEAIQQRKSKIASAAETVAKATDELLEANKLLEALEKLEQRQFSEFQSRQSAIELRELEDLSARQHRRQ